jgi:hypothetical protein
MHHQNKIANETDVEYLRAELASSQKLNQELHRRVQRCEGADARIDYMRDNMENNFEKHCKMWRERMMYWKKRAYSAERKLDELPFFIRWMIK